MGQRWQGEGPGDSKYVGRRLAPRGGALVDKDVTLSIDDACWLLLRAFLSD